MEPERATCGSCNMRQSTTTQDSRRRATTHHVVHGSVRRATRRTLGAPSLWTEGCAAQALHRAVSIARCYLAWRVVQVVAYGALHCCTLLRRCCPWRCSCARTVAHAPCLTPKKSRIIADCSASAASAPHRYAGPLYSWYLMINGLRRVRCNVESDGCDLIKWRRVSCNV